MDHSEIEKNEIVERYIRKQLTPEARKAFQEHFFACDQCFEQVRATERFVVGVRHAAASDLLPARRGVTSGAERGFPWIGWMNATRMATALSILLLAFVGIWLFQVSGLRTELALERKAREQAEQQNHNVQQLLAQQQLNPVAGTPQANIPVVMLEATRDTGNAPTVVLPAGAHNLVLWVDVSADSSHTFQLRIYTKDDRLIQTVEDLKKNKYGALAVALPARSLAGQYIIKLYSMDSRQPLLRAQYRLRVTSA